MHTKTLFHQSSGASLKSLERPRRSNAVAQVTWPERPNKRWVIMTGTICVSVNSLEQLQYQFSDNSHGPVPIAYHLLLHGAKPAACLGQSFRIPASWVCDLVSISARAKEDFQKMPALTWRLSIYDNKNKLYHSLASWRLFGTVTWADALLAEFFVHYEGLAL